MARAESRDCDRVPLDALTIEPYTLPLTRPWRTARGERSQRCGWLITAVSGTTRGHGDCAPLPEAGTEDAVSAAAGLATLRDALSGLTLSAALDHPALSTGRAPAAVWGVECALLDLLARLAGVPLRHAIAERTGLPPPGERVQLNAALGDLAAVSQALLDRSLAQGYRVLKLKIGRERPQTELARLARLAAHLPSGVALRLDANGAWEPWEARLMVAGLTDLPVESLEEPLGRPAAETLTALQASAGFAIAVDESLPGYPSAADIPVRRAVLKPAVLGGVRPTLRMAQALQSSGKEVVITSVLDSSAGLWAAAQLAALLPAPASGPLAHGLATADWLAQDLGPPPPVEDAAIRLGPEPGSGFAPY